MTSPVLAVEDVTVRFGGITAVSNVSFAVDKGEFVGLIGPNGAGKTTLLRTITGLNTKSDGRVIVDGRDITRDRVPARIRAGLGLSHQIVRPFRSMTILENVMIAAGRRQTSSALRAIASLDRQSKRNEAIELLRLVGLADQAEQFPAMQPLGILKRLEVARALGTKPNILLLDEPLAGLGSTEATELADLLVEINRGGVTIVLIEHNLVEAQRTCQRFVVLDNGHMIADGPVKDVLQDRKVFAAYLGGGPPSA